MESLLLMLSAYDNLPTNIFTHIFVQEDDDNLSEMSGLSDLSGKNWKPNMSGRLSWLHRYHRYLPRPWCWFQVFNVFRMRILFLILCFPHADFVSHIDEHRTVNLWNSVKNSHCLLSAVGSLYLVPISVADPWHFVVYPELDPRIHASD